jgi:hypothetical protein
MAARVVCETTVWRIGGEAEVQTETTTTKVHSQRARNQQHTSRETCLMVLVHTQDSDEDKRLRHDVILIFCFNLSAARILHSTFFNR